MSEPADNPSLSPPGQAASSGPEPPETPEHAARSTKRWFMFLGAWLADIVLLDVALNFPQRSPAYQWTNRIGIFLGLPLVFGGCVVGIIITSRWRGARSVGRVGYGAALLLPLIFVAKLFGRILEAFWLR